MYVYIYLQNTVSLIMTGTKSTNKQMTCHCDLHRVCALDKGVTACLTCSVLWAATVKCTLHLNAHFSSDPWPCT